MPSTKKIHFEVSERKVLLRIFDVLSVLLVLYCVSTLFDFGYFKFNTQTSVYALILVMYLMIFATIFEMYDLHKASKMDVVSKNIILTTSVTVLFYLLTPFLTPTLPENRLQIVYFFLSIACALLLWRLAYISFIASPRFNKRVLVVGDSFDIELIKQALQKYDPNYFIVGYINTDTEDGKKVKKIKKFPVENLSETIENHQVSEIVVASNYTRGVKSDLYNQLIGLLKIGFPIREYTQVYEEITHRIPVQYIDKDFYRFFPFSRSNQNKLYLFFHRFFDVVFSLFGILVSCLVLPFILIGNICANRGPVFYKQERVGKNGRIFNIIKFRTMIKDAEKSGAQWAQKNDMRITSFGRFLRRSRLDEIPQFYNILKGEMSFIGPRPERPVFVKELSEMIPFYETRHVIKPGLTGWAQVKTPYGSSYDDSLEKLQYDLYYIKHRSLFLDLNIAVKTFSAVIFFRGQ